MLAGLFAIAILIARLFPTTPTGRWLHLTLVEIPVDWLSRVERKHVIFLLIMLLAGPSLALALPVELALLYAFDLSVYLDVVVAVGTLGAASRAKLVWARFETAVARAVAPAKILVGVTPRPRATRPRVRKTPANRNDADRPARFLRAA
ncbi:MAG: hypothetical protein M3Q57_06705 [Pseudomonadota bacterium]|nr:hypothetical protein [Pseudomonadota bacterium]